MNILEYAKFKQGILKECVLLEDNQDISGKKRLTDRLHTKDIYVGGYFDSNGNWKDSVDTSSSLHVSGTVEFLGEVHADNASFHTHHMDVGGELKVAGDARFDHDVRMTHSLRVDSKADIREGATIRGTLDMKGNDVKNVQSLKVNGTLDTYNDIKMKPNTGREDRVKLSDALNEALDFTFKNRVQIDGTDIQSIGTLGSPLERALAFIETTSASIIDLKDTILTHNWTAPIVLTKSVTFKGSKKNKATLIINIDGVAEGAECTLFQVDGADITIGFDNVEIIVNSSVNNIHFTMIEYDQHVASEGLEYTLADNGASYICSGIGTCTDTDVVIPEMYNGLPVTSIGESAFAHCSQLNSVELSFATLDIQSKAFEGCTGLTRIIFFKNLYSIGIFAFSECKSLSSVYISDTVKNIGVGAFCGCPNLTIYCETAYKPEEWHTEWNISNLPVVWGATMPRRGLNLDKFSIKSNFTRRWHLHRCDISIINSALDSKDKIVGVADEFMYSNNNGATSPDFTALYFTKTSKLDFFRGELLVNGSRVLTEDDKADIINAVLEQIASR